MDVYEQADFLVKHRKENPDPKPVARTRATKAEWRAIHDHFAGSSCVCGVPFEHLHHVLPRARGGSDAVENLIGLCAVCHDGVHGRANKVALDRVRRALTPGHLMYLDLWLGTVAGADFLDRRYPLLEREAA